VAHDRIDQLADALLRINNGEATKEESMKVLSTISEVDLSKAEQRLLERGITPQELQGLCKVHLEVLDRKAKDLLEATEPGHPLNTLIGEHQMILGFLDSLEQAANTIERATAWDITLEEALSIARNISAHLSEAEKHHEREEKALFPALEERGITGPTRIMRMEHADMRSHKKRLSELVEHAAQHNYAEVKDEIVNEARYIAANLREHIVKENSILYPAAFEAINYDAAWDSIRRTSDDIGYCCFTPGLPPTV
jgi:DUF438 domain-containing protein